MKLHLAPLQGYTESDYRQAFADVYGSAADVVLYTPFLRLEKGAPARRGVRDATADGAAGLVTVPQIIFNSTDEFTALTDLLTAAGHDRIDLNLGCPFAPQVRHGRGAGLLARPDVVRDVARLITDRPACTFSVKMRLGVDRPDQWKEIVDVFNDVPLSHVAVHARTAAMQYAGSPLLDEFALAAEAITHPVVYNGDIKSPRDIDAILSRFPSLSGVMIGRGALARPSLFAEWSTGTEWNREQRLEAIGRLHALYSERLAARLCGDHQLLSKLKPFWDYLEDEIGHRNYKAIRKSRNLDAYDTAVAAALR